MEPRAGSTLLFVFLCSRSAASLPRLEDCAPLAMLACLQRRPNPPPPHPLCASKTPEPLQALGRKCELPQ